MSAAKYTALNDPLYGYVRDHQFDAVDPLLADLRRTTAELGDAARMQVSPDQGAFLTLFAKALGARTAIEVGTFTGYSALCLARGLADDGHLYCHDVSESYGGIARDFWARAGLGDRISLTIGDAGETLPHTLGTCGPVDLAFVDADKTGYPAYFDALLPAMRPGGFILFDNMLWHGRVKDTGDESKSTRAIRHLNDCLVADERVEASLQPIADGLMICRKR